MHHSKPTWGNVVRDSLSAGGTDRRMARRCQSHGVYRKNLQSTGRCNIEGSIAGTSLAFENQKKGPAGKDRHPISQAGAS